MAKAKAWLESQDGLIVSGITGLLLAYAFVSRAIDTGSYWQYAGGIAFLIFGIKLLIRAQKK